MGCVTLVMACAFAGGWFRSVGFQDFLSFPSGEFSEDYLSSSNGFLGWGLSRVDSPFYKPSFRLTIGLPTNLNRINELKFRTRWNCFGCTANDFYEIGESECVVPYGFVVVPLTLLSAWLLLSKPRTPQPNISAHANPQRPGFHSPSSRGFVRRG
jgi:hypothetical protein